MLITRELFISKGRKLVNIEELQNINDIFKISIDGVEYFSLVEKRVDDIDEATILEEIYNKIFISKIEENNALGFIDRDDFKLFIYGKKNQYINNLIVATKIPDLEQPEKTEKVTQIEFGVSEKKELKLHYRIENITQNFTLGNVDIIQVTPQLNLVNSNGERFNIEIKNINCDDSEGLLEYRDGKLSLTENKSKLMDQFPVQTRVYKKVNFTAIFDIDGQETQYRDSLRIDIFNEKTMRGNIEGVTIDAECLFIAIDDVDQRSTFATQDIGFLAEAIFEIDEKLLLIQEQLPGINTMNFSELLAAKVNTKKGVSCMAELWARWIQTGRRKFSQCPEQYREEVRQLLADAGLNEDGQPLRK